MEHIELYLDVSSVNTGVCILDVNTREVILTSINLKSLSKPANMPIVDFQKTKIGLIKQELDSLLKGYIVDKVYLEGIFVQPKFLNSSEFLLKIHGFLMGYFMDVRMYFIAPKVIKKMITGSGNGNKEEVQKALKKVYDIESFPDSDHSDAFALCVYQNNWEQFPIISIQTIENIVEESK